MNQDKGLLYKAFKKGGKGMKKVTNVALSLALTMSVFAVPVSASTSLPLPKDSTENVDSKDVKLDDGTTEALRKDSPVSTEAKSSEEENVLPKELAPKASKTSLKQEPIKVEIEEVKEKPATEEVVKEDKTTVKPEAKVETKVETKETTTVKKPTVKAVSEKQTVKKEVSKESTKKFVKDETKSVNKNGIPIEIAYVSDGEFVPSFTLTLRDGNGKFISSTPVGKQNYSGLEGKYKIVLKHKGFKLGDKLRIQLSSVGKGVTGLNLTSNKQEVKDNKMTIIDYDVKPNQYMPFTVLSQEYLVDEAKGEWGRELTPSTYNVIHGELITQAKQSAVKVLTTSGTPVSNATVFLQFAPNKKVKLKTDAGGMVWFDKALVQDSNFLISVLKYDFVDGEKNIQSVKTYESNGGAISTYDVTVSKATPTSVAEVQNGTVAVNVVTKGNTTISKNWVSSDLIFTNSKGEDIRITLNDKDTTFNLDSGTYKVRAESDYANVSLSTKSLKVSKGKVNMSVTMSPKYTLQVSADGGSNKYQFLNVESLKGKTFSGAELKTFGVVPGESYMIADATSGDTYTVVIDEKSTATQLILGKGVVYGGNVSNPHTGDAIIYLFIMLFVALTCAGVAWTIYYKNRKVTNATAGIIAFLALAGGLLPLYSTPVKVSAAGTAGGTGAKGNYSQQTLTGDVMVDPEAFVGVSFVHAVKKDAGREYILDGQAQRSDMKTQYQFKNDNIKKTFYMAPNKTVYNRIKKSDTALATYTSSERIQPVWGTTNLPLQTSTTAAEFRANYGFHDKLQERILPYSSTALNSKNEFIKFMGKVMAESGQDSATRQVWKGSLSNAKLNIGDAIAKEYNDTVAPKKGDSASTALRKKELSRKILYGYVDLLENAGEKEAATAIKDNFIDGDEPYVFLFQTMNTYRIQGKSSKRTIVSLPDGSEWFKEGRSKSGAYRDSYRAIEDSEQAKSVYWNLGDSGTGSSLRRQYPVFNFTQEIRPKSGSSLKPKSANVPVKYPATTRENLKLNPFLGWGYLNWQVTSAAEDNQSVNLPNLYMDLKVTPVDDKGKSVGKTVTVPYDLDKNKEGINGISIKTGLEDKAINSINGKMSFMYKNKLYNLKKDNSAYITMKDTKDTNDSLLKLNSKYQFEMRKKIKGQSKLITPVPSFSNSSNWALYTGIDTPAWKNLRFYLGGYSSSSEYKALSKVGDAKYTQSTKTKFSHAKIVLNIKAEVMCFDPKNPSCVDEANARLDVPQWRISKYTSDLAPSNRSTGTFNIPLKDMSGYKQTLTNSGTTQFSLVNPDLSKTKWAISKSKWFNEKSSRYIGVSTLYAMFNVGGDLLAVKDNGSVGNVKLASWLSQRPLFSGRVGLTSAGSAETDKKLVTKQHDFTYGVNSGHKSYTYTDKRDYQAKDSKGKLVTKTKTYTEKVAPVYVKSKYDTTVKFSRYVPDKTDAKDLDTFNNAHKTSNGVYWEALVDRTKINVNPEVLMAYDDTNGRTSVAFVAGDRLREVQPIHYNSAQYKSIVIEPKVQGMSTATDQRAKELARKLGANGVAVAYKGSSITSNFTVAGQLELKTYAIDIGASSLKNAWGNSTYVTDRVNDTFLREFGTKGKDGKWTVKVDAKGSMKIGSESKAVGGKGKLLTAKQASVSLKEHTLVIRGGKLVSVDGNKNLGSLSTELKNALTRMKISTTENIFGAFESDEGSKLSEKSVATLGNAIRGTSDLKVGKGWYNEDTTVLVVREYTNKFDLPNFLYVDKIPMKVTGLETPIDKSQFFSKGKIGYTVLQLEVAKASMTYDSSLASPYGGETSKSFIVPNVSVMDTFQ